MKLLVRRALPDVGECEITLEVYQEDERMIGAIYQLDGKINLRPKAWLRLVRDELRTIETVAKDAGCVELRMAGRFKRNIFPDYQPFEPLSGAPGLRKEL